MAEGEFASLTELLGKVEAASAEGVSIETVQALAGPSSFGPMILLPGLVAVSPLSGIPTVPSMIGLIVATVSIQLVVGRDHFWLPERARRARLAPERARKALAFLRPVARRVDRVVKPRFAFATNKAAQRAAALVCFLTAATMPPLEILPFLATTAGIVLTIFGLAITLRDGLLMIAGLVVLLGGLSALGYVFLF